MKKSKKWIIYVACYLVTLAVMSGFTELYLNKGQAPKAEQPRKETEPAWQPTAVIHLDNDKMPPLFIGNLKDGEPIKEFSANTLYKKYPVRLLPSGMVRQATDATVQASGVLQSAGRHYRCGAAHTVSGIRLQGMARKKPAYPERIAPHEYKRKAINQRFFWTM